MSFDNSQMPPDPFADDPNDPASFLEPEEEFPPLSDMEMEALREDLKNVRDFRRLLEPRGIRGITMMCEDCEETHYYDWSIIETNILTMLNRENTPVHEPSAQPKTQAYVTWDYCLGYADAMDFAFHGMRPPFMWGNNS